MGGLFSKKRDKSPSLIQLNRDWEYGTELSSHGAPDWRVINTLAVGVQLRRISFDSLKEFTGNLAEMNQEEVKIILDCWKDIRKNKELFELVDEYFKNSLQTLDICTSLEKCLKKAQDIQLIFHAALQRFDEEDGGKDGQKYLRTLEELKNFKTAGDPFTDEFLHTFRSVRNRQLKMGNELPLRKRKLNEKLKSVKARRKVSGIIFAAAFASFLICSVVTATVASPPVASALSAVTSIPLGSMAKWVDSLWKNYGDALKGRKGVINSMLGGTYIVLEDLENIGVLVDRIEIEIKYLLYTVDFSLGEEAVKFGIEEIKKKLGVFMQSIDGFMQSIDGLSEHIEKCSRDIREARAVVLESIIKLPNE